MITFITTFLPIFILAVIFGTTMYAFRLNSKKSLFGGNKTAVLIGGYVFILVVGTIVSYSLLPSESSVGKSISDSAMRNHFRQQADFDDRVINEKIFSPNNKVLGKSKKWKIPFKGKNFNIMMDEQSEYFPNVLIDNKPGKDGVIEVFAYSGTPKISGIDFTKEIKLPGIELNNDTLTILPPSSVKVKVAKYTEGYAAHQFVKKRTKDEDEGFNIGNDYIFLKVPKGVKLDGNGVIEYTYVDVK